MKLRIAKKILKDQSRGWYDRDGNLVRLAYSDEQVSRAASRFQQYERNSARSKLSKEAVRLGRKVEEGAPLDECHGEWLHIREKLRTVWFNGKWDRENADHVRTLDLKHSREELGLDLEYYSDRWCEWRVRVIDLHFRVLLAT